MVVRVFLFLFFHFVTSELLMASIHTYMHIYTDIRGQRHLLFQGPIYIHRRCSYIATVQPLPHPLYSYIYIYIHNFFFLQEQRLLSILVYTYRYIIRWRKSPKQPTSSLISMLSFMCLYIYISSNKMGDPINTVIYTYIYIYTRSLPFQPCPATYSCIYIPMAAFFTPA